MGARARAMRRLPLPDDRAGDLRGLWKFRARRVPRHGVLYGPCLLLAVHPAGDSGICEIPGCSAKRGMAPKRVGTSAELAAPCDRSDRTQHHHRCGRWRCDRNSCRRCSRTCSGCSEWSCCISIGFPTSLARSTGAGPGSGRAIFNLSTRTSTSYLSDTSSTSPAEVHGLLET